MGADLARLTVSPAGHGFSSPLPVVRGFRGEGCYSNQKSYPYDIMNWYITSKRIVNNNATDSIFIS